MADEMRELAADMHADLDRLERGRHTNTSTLSMPELQALADACKTAVQRSVFTALLNAHYPGLAAKIKLPGGSI